MLCDLQVHSSMVLGGLLDYLVIFRSSARHLQKGVHFMLRDLYEVALHGKPVISALLKVDSESSGWDEFEHLKLIIINWTRIFLKYDDSVSVTG